jgi:hypothetical protein
VVDVDDLKQQITAARGRGDTRELERLQAIFRTHPGIVTTAAGRGHPLPRARIESVRPVGRLGARVVGGSSTPTVQGPTSWPTTVEFGSNIRELFDSFDGAESGAFLVGPIASADDDGVILVTHTVAPAEDYNRSRYRVSLDLDGAIENMIALPSNQTILGDYHLHPAEGDTHGSSTDVRAWQAMAKFFDKPWLGVVARTAPATAPNLSGRLVEIGRLEITATLVNPDGRSRQLEIT